MASNQTPDMSSDPSQPTQVNPTGHTNIGQVPTGHAPTGHAPTGHTPIGHAPPGHTPTGHAPTGHAPTGHAPTGHAPTGHTSMGHTYTSHTATGHVPMGSTSTGHTNTVALPPDLVRPYFQGGKAFTLGVVQCVMGMALFVQQVMFIHLFVYAIQYTAAGVWTGILVIVAGVFGCLAGRTKKDYLISTWKVLCVMSVVACVLTFATSVIGAISSCNDWVLCVDIAPSARIALGITMAVFSMATGGISFASAITPRRSGEPTTFQSTQGGYANPMYNFQPYSPTPGTPYTQQQPYQTPNLQVSSPDYSQGTTGPRAPATQGPGNDMNINM